MKILFSISLLFVFAGLGVAQNATDIIVKDKVVVQRCVLKGAFARAVAVGAPGGFNYAFDAMNCAPAFVWQGEFLNFNGETNGRGGNGAKILGFKQSLGIDKVPFRIGDPAMQPESVRFRGYRRDATSSAPTFMFETDGVAVEQTVNSTEANVVRLGLAFPVAGKAKRYYLLDPNAHLGISLSEGLRWSGAGVIEIPAEAKAAAITIRLKPKGGKYLRKEEKLSGGQLFANYCSACHSTDGTKLIGPGFEGFWGSEREVIVAGKPARVTADAAYVKESITKPQAAIVKGYEAVPMADFSAVLSSEDIESLVSYLKSLGSD